MPSIEETSVAEEYRFIKEFDFSQALGRNVFADLTFSDSDLVRLDPYDMNVRLKKLSTGYYSTASDIWFMTWVSNPKSLRELLMIQVKGTNPKDTSWQVRMFDGTNHLFWDTSLPIPDWAVASTGDWNDEGTINAHLDTFPTLPDREFAVVVNLITTDKYETPRVNEILVLMKIRIDYLEDIVFRSLIPLMKAQLRPVGNFPLPAMTTDSSTIDLNDYEMDTPFNIVDVEAVFNFSTDDELLTNILDSFNPGTKVITLTTPILEGEIPFVLFRYEPEIVYTTHQDYTEVAKLPVYILKSIEVPLESSYTLAAREGIVDKGTGDAVLVLEPWRVTLEFRLHAISDRAVDEMRMMSAVMKFFDANKLIKSVGLDEKYSMVIIREFRDITNPNRADEREFWTRFQIKDIRMPLTSEDTKGITKLILNFTEPEPPHEDPTKGGSRVVIRTHTDDTPSVWKETFEITD